MNFEGNTLFPLSMSKPMSGP